MAKIVTYEEQVQALKRVGEELKVLAKMKPLLELEAECCKVTVAVTDRAGQTIKAGYKLEACETYSFLVGYYREAVKRVQMLLKEHHIALDESEKELLRFCNTIQSRTG